MKLYFAYGSNMDPKQIGERIRRAPSRKPAVLAEYKLCFNKQADCKPGIGYANIVPADGESVHGILYQVTEDELARLDIKEGVHTDHYFRHEVTVLPKDGQEVDAITYIACPDRTGDGLLPKRCYLDRLLAARDDLPEEYVHFLESHPVVL